MKEIVNFDQLTTEGKKALVQLLNKHRFKDVFPKGEMDDVTLSHRILRHFNSKKSRNRWPSIRYEVLDNDVHSKVNGAHTSYYKSLYTLSLTQKNVLSIKKRKTGTERIVKETAIDYSNIAHKRQVGREAKYMERQPRFHSKSLVYGDGSTFIVMRQPSGTPLGKFLLNKSLDLVERYNLTLALLTEFKEQIYNNELVHRNIRIDNVHIEKNRGTYDVTFYDYSSIKEESYNDTQEQKIRHPSAPPEFFKANVRTNKKYDIYLMGVLLFYVWGGLVTSKTGEPNISRYESRPVSVDFKNLGKFLVDKPGCMDEIVGIIKLMCHENAEQRLGIDAIIEKFKDLKLSFVASEIPKLK